MQYPVEDVVVVVPGEAVVVEPSYMDVVVVGEAVVDPGADVVVGAAVVVVVVVVVTVGTQQVNSYGRFAPGKPDGGPGSYPGLQVLD